MTNPPPSQDFLDSLSSQLTTTPNLPPTSIATRASFSRKTARHLLADFNSKEVRKGIDTLRRRIEKHFGEIEGESAAASRNLVGFVCKEAENYYERTLERAQGLVASVYPNAEGEKSVEVEFGREDVRGGFRR